MRVPIHYGPREKFLARLDGNKNLDRKIAITLPRMAFELTNLYYDSDRRLAKTNRILATDPNDSSKTISQYTPTPYNFEFTLWIMVKNAEDGAFIVEQILPYFNPGWTAALNINPDMGQSYDVPLSLDSIVSEDTYEGDFITRRAIIWTLTFTMKGWIFGPTNRDESGIIKDVDVSFTIPGLGLTVCEANSTNSSTSTSFNVTPGQDANGTPVSWYGDANSSARPEVVNTSTISIGDDYGFMTDFTGDE